MKVTEVRLQPLRMRPPPDGEANAFSELLLVKLLTDDGLEGLGEACPGYAYTGETIWTVEDVIHQHLAPSLIGCDPVDIQGIEARWEIRGTGNQAARGALEMALWDLRGKALGVPVWNLLGGRCRSQVPEAYPLDRHEDDKAVVGRVETLFREGVRVFKLYLRVGDDAELDPSRLRLVGAIRKVCGDAVEIRVDANGGWPDARTAVRAIRSIDRFQPSFVEEPVPVHDLVAARWVREHVETPICLDESVVGQRDAMAAVVAQACDVISIKLMKSGGILNAIRIAAIAESAGIRVHLGNMGHAGIGCAALLHLHGALAYATSSDIDLPSRGSDFAEDIATGLTHHLEGAVSMVTVPTSPGLGVELRVEAVEAQRWARPWT